MNKDTQALGISGFEICKQLKEHVLMFVIPLIFVTSHSDPETKRMVLMLGAIQSISKPVDIELCRIGVKKHLTIQEQRPNVNGCLCMILISLNLAMIATLIYEQRIALESK